MRLERKHPAPFLYLFRNPVFVLGFIILGISISFLDNEPRKRNAMLNILI